MKGLNINLMLKYYKTLQNKAKILKTYYLMFTNIIKLMPIIKASSIIVIVLIGKLKTAPRQAHFIFLLLSTV